jgi:beta-lactam-binding protein with PASTA domain
MGFFYFLKKKKFYKHLIYAIILTFILLWISLKILEIYTRHDNVYIVPDFTGKTLNEIKQEGYADYFNFLVIDSVYDQKSPKGSIFMQNPEPGSKVKQGRRMYLTIVATTPEKVIMPDLKNLSLRQAMVTLEINGLKTGKLEYVDYFARNAVIDQLINEEPIDPGTEIFKGSAVDLVVGKGKMDVYVPLPFIVGKSPEEAEHELHYASLNVGKEVYIDNDKQNAKVFKTEPEQLSDKKLKLGDKIDIWYRSSKTFDFDQYIDELLGDTIPQEQELNNPY